VFSGGGDVFGFAMGIGLRGLAAGKPYAWHIPMTFFRIFLPPECAAGDFWKLCILLENVSIMTSRDYSPKIEA
jgi:hypothetical protein